MFYLPGIDGTGLAAYRQFPRLSNAFDLRCLLLPRTDTSSFEALLDTVEVSVSMWPPRHTHAPVECMCSSSTTMPVPWTVCMSACMSLHPHVCACMYVGACTPPGSWPPTYPPICIFCMPHTLCSQALLRAELQAPGVGGRPVYLLGESFGGILALALAPRLGDLVDRLVLVNPATSFSDSPWPLAGPLLTRIDPGLYRLLPFALAPLLANPLSMAAADVDTRAPLLRQGSDLLYVSHGGTVLQYCVGHVHECVFECDTIDQCVLARRQGGLN
jgi:hypothetical protein